MKNLFPIFSLLFLLSNFTIAQNRISGKVLDDKNKPIYFATVALYQSSDSTIVKAESTNEKGLFVLNDIHKGEYYLVTSMLGFTDKKSNSFSVDDIDLNFDFALGTDANLMETVEIVDRVPLLEQKADKLIVNVENNITNTSGNLLDVMKKVPGMLVINDRLTMAGVGSPTILINGKSTQYMDVQSLLRDMPGDNIKKVEIIHQPGAEYEAAGSGPILNIILKKNALFGTNGSITLGASKGTLWDYTTGVNLSHYSGPLNITAGFGHSKNAWVDRLILKRTLTNIDSEIDGVYDQVSLDQATPNSNRANLRVDLDVSPKHRIGLATKFYNNKNNRVSTNTTNINLFNESAADYNLFTENDRESKWNYYTFNPYYIFEIDTVGQKLEVDVNVARYNPEGENTLTTTNDLNTRSDVQRYMQPGKTKIFASTLDYTLPLNSVFELKTGAKYSFADLDNNLISTFINENGDWENNLNQSNHYFFEERIYAGYLKLLFSKDKWTGTAGLRYENSESKGKSETIDSTLTRDISKLFPSFSLSRKLGDVLTSTISYSYRIDRPRYSSLNPFVYYLDPFTYESGNPNIRPELTHSAKFTLSYEGQPFFNVEYKKSNDAIVEVTRQEANSQEASKTDINFDDQSYFSTSLFFPLDFIPGISGGYGGVIVAQNQYNSFYENAIFDRTRWSTTAFIQLEFTLPWELNAEIGGWYNSGEQEGIFNSEYLYGTSFGISKKFLDDKAKFSLGVEDFANRFWHANVDYQQDMQIISEWQAPVVSARFSYKFGNQHLKSKKKNMSSASEEINRATQN